MTGTRSGRRTDPLGSVTRQHARDENIDPAPAAAAAAPASKHADLPAPPAAGQPPVEHDQHQQQQQQQQQEVTPTRTSSDVQFMGRVDPPPNRAIPPAPQAPPPQAEVAAAAEPGTQEAIRFMKRLIQEGIPAAAAVAKPIPYQLEVQAVELAGDLVRSGRLSKADIDTIVDSFMAVVKPAIDSPSFPAQTGAEKAAAARTAIEAIAKAAHWRARTDDPDTKMAISLIIAIATGIREQLTIAYSGVAPTYVAAMLAKLGPRLTAAIERQFPGPDGYKAFMDIETQNLRTDLAQLGAEAQYNINQDTRVDKQSASMTAALTAILSAQQAHLPTYSGDMRIPYGGGGVKRGADGEPRGPGFTGDELDRIKARTVAPDGSRSEACIRHAKHVVFGLPPCHGPPTCTRKHAPVPADIMAKYKK